MVKVISLSDEAYERLKTFKRNKSFSEVVIEFANRKGTMSDLKRFFGIWKDNTDEWRNIKNVLDKDRKKAKLREVNW